jgi:glycosyltransferase involved in cell wall biosynthesis
MVTVTIYAMTMRAVSDVSREVTGESHLPRVFYIGDHPALTTGFGTVAYYLTTGLHQLGWSVHVFGALAEEGTVPTGLFPFPVLEMPAGMPYGETVLAEALVRNAPDIVLLNNEHRTLGTWAAIAREALGPNVPLIAYRGAAVDEMPPADVRLFGLVDHTIAYTEFAGQAIEKMAGLPSDVVPHGLNHQVFRPPSAEERKQVRERLDWDDETFGVLYISRNRPNKKHHRVMRALARLRNEGLDGVRCCFHCRPVVTETFRMPDGTELPGGFDLPAVAGQLGVQDLITFTGAQDDDARGVHQVLGRWDGKRLVEPDLTMAQLYWAADLYLNPSDLETFGLPLVEAMACGTPVAHPDNCANRLEVCGDAAWRLTTVRIKAWPEDWEIRKLTDAAIADAILHFKTLRDEHRDQLAQWRRRGIEWVAKYDWGRSAEMIAESLHRWVARS